VLALALILGLLSAAGQPQPRTGDAELVAQFQKSVADYVDLHRRMDSTLTEMPEGSTPEQILIHQRSLEVLIRGARRRAKAGDIFTRDIRAYFRRQIARAIDGPNGREIRDTIMEENPRTIRLNVNSRYPDSLPVSTTPAPILLLLPKLPAELEYRFVGDRLALLDIHAGTVVDYIDDALGR
jgi:hypothetical protein